MAEAFRPERPVFVIRPSEPTTFKGTARSNPKTSRPTKSRQGERLDGRFDELSRLLGGSTTAPATDAFPAGDPELVVVFEVVDTTPSNLRNALVKAGLEPLLDVEDEYAGDDSDFVPLPNKDGSVKSASLFVHASMANESAVRQILSLWAAYKADKNLPLGMTPFRDLFNCLKDLRIWGLADRIRNTGLDSLIEEALANELEAVPVQVELWYRSTSERRQAAEASIRGLLAQAGATDVSVAEHEAIGYHAFAATMPVSRLEAVRSAETVTTATDLALLRSPSVLFVRPGGQRTGTALEDELPTTDDDGDEELPSGRAIVAVLDGLPAANHPRLQNRLIVFDPDRFSSDPTYTVERRVHGTMVASAVVWGDLNRKESPLRRPVLVRPILKPDLKTRNDEEGVPWNLLAPDVTVRAVREICGSPEGREVKIFNLSVGDRLGQFDTIPSAWARSLDWLAHEYNVLFVVSAGNHPGALLIDPDAIRAGDPDRTVSDVLLAAAPTRRLLSPAESMNALTVGALHADGSGEISNLGYRLNLWDGENNVSPVSAAGRGQRRSIKPDLVAAGGRRLYSEIGGGAIKPYMGTALPPGVLLATPPNKQAYDSGTTFAAAEVSRRAARIAELLLDQSDIDDQYIAVATKALLVHGAKRGDIRFSEQQDDRFFGHGSLTRDLGEGCLASQATAIFLGDIKAGFKAEIVMPMPEDVAKITDVRRVTTTLAWMSPINWGHRQYRRAKLTVDGPTEIESKHRTNDALPHYHLGQRGTVEHHSFETKRAYVAEQLTFTVKCAGQAGGFEGPVRFAVAVTLEVGPGIAIPVYDLVRQQIQARIRNK